MVRVKMGVKLQINFISLNTVDITLCDTALSIGKKITLVGNNKFILNIITSNM